MKNDGILVTDLDGTLLDQHGHLPIANCDALRRCADQGLTLVLATGRNLTITRPIADAICTSANVRARSPSMWVIRSAGRSPGSVTPRAAAFSAVVVPAGIPAAYCGLVKQALDLQTCTLSNVHTL